MEVMSSVCQKCSLKINSNQRDIACFECARKFHGSCVNLSSGDVSFLNDNKKPWLCKECTDEGRRRRSASLTDITLRHTQKTTGAHLASTDRGLLDASDGASGLGSSEVVSADVEHLTTRHFDLIMDEFARARSAHDTLSSKLSSLIETQSLLSQAVEKCNATLSEHASSLEQHSTSIAENSRMINDVHDKLLLLEQRFETAVDSGDVRPEAPRAAEATGSSADTNALLSELNERERRRTNIMLFNIPESRSSAIKDRIADDLQAARQVIDSLEINTDIRRAIRMGRPGDNIRPLKLTLSSREDVLKCLRNRDKLKDTNFRISSDLTHMQRTHMNELREELDRRTNGGERNLTIKYVNDVPRIVRKSNRSSKK